MRERVPVAKEVMVLGDAPEARATADQLLELGYSVSWVSPGDAPHSSGLCHPRLVSYGDCQLTALGGQVGRFRVQVSQDAQVARFPASALVVAVGNDRYYPAERYGLAASSNVMAVSQVQMQCDEQRTCTSAEPHRRGSVLMMLDLGGETGKEMATEALHLALRLREEWRSEVYLFYQNLKVDSSNHELLTRQMREKGVVFCRYASPKIDVGEGWVSVSYVEGTLRGELLVLPEAIRPHRDTQRIAGLLNVHLGEDGFFQDINIHHLRSGFSSRKGIFFAGRCHLDLPRQEVEADAAQAAANVDALLGAGFLEPEGVIAHVESSKCIRCLTCIRTCPHAAVELAEYEGVGGNGSAVIAARVAELACRGCGACVANCPVQAISLSGQEFPAWMVTEPSLREMR